MGDQLINCLRTRRAEVGREVASCCWVTIAGSSVFLRLLFFECLPGVLSRSLSFFSPSSSPPSTFVLLDFLGFVDEAEDEDEDDLREEGDDDDEDDEEEEEEEEERETAARREEGPGVVLGWVKS